MPRPLQRRHLSRANVLGRAAWTVVQTLLFRPTPRPLHAWRAWLLRRFGARIGRGVRIYATARIWAPWQLTMEDEACLGDHVDCYCVEKITLQRGAIVSQYGFLCSASHDFEAEGLPLVAAPITIGAQAWVTADVFVGPGITIGDGAVVLARSTVVRDLPPWQVCGGSPARALRPRRWPGRDAAVSEAPDPAAGLAPRTAGRTGAGDRRPEGD